MSLLCWSYQQYFSAPKWFLKGNQAAGIHFYLYLAIQMLNTNTEFLPLLKTMIIITLNSINNKGISAVFVPKSCHFSRKTSKSWLHLLHVHWAPQVVSLWTAPSAPLPPPWPAPETHVHVQREQIKSCVGASAVLFHNAAVVVFIVDGQRLTKGQEEPKPPALAAHRGERWQASHRIIIG